MNLHVGRVAGLILVAVLVVGLILAGLLLAGGPRTARIVDCAHGYHNIAGRQRLRAQRALTLSSLLTSPHHRDLQHHGDPPLPLSTGIVRARKLSQATMSNIRQSLVFALAAGASGRHPQRPPGAQARGQVTTQSTPALDVKRLVGGRCSSIVNLPVAIVTHSEDRPIPTSVIEVLQGPVESAALSTTSLVFPPQPASNLRSSCCYPR